MLIKFDFESSEPLYLQLRNQVVIGIAQGELKAGEKLPTIRALADESGINMMTVSKAYQLLKQEGYIVTDRRSGAVVSTRAPKGVSESTMKSLRICISEFRLNGYGYEEIAEICRKIYEEGDGK